MFSRSPLTLGFSGFGLGVSGYRRLGALGFRDRFHLFGACLLGLGRSAVNRTEEKTFVASTAQLRKKVGIGSSSRAASGWLCASARSGSHAVCRASIWVRKDLTGGKTKQP